MVPTMHHLSMDYHQMHDGGSMYHAEMTGQYQPAQSPQPHQQQQFHHQLHYAQPPMQLPTAYHHHQQQAANLGSYPALQQQPPPHRMHMHMHTI